MFNLVLTCIKDVLMMVKIIIAIVNSWQKETK